MFHVMSARLEVEKGRCRFPLAWGPPAAPSREEAKGCMCERLLLRPGSTNYSFPAKWLCLFQPHEFHQNRVGPRENNKKNRASSEVKPNQRLREKKKKVWLWFLSSPGTSWVSIHANKLFSCLKKHCKIHISNTKWYQTYVIHHQTFIFFSFSSQSCCFTAQRSGIVSTSLHTAEIIPPIPMQEANAGTRGYNAGRLCSSFLFFFYIQAVLNHAIHIWAHADRKVWHCMKSAKMYSFIQA